MAEATRLSEDAVGLILTEEEATALYTLSYIYLPAGCLPEISKALARIKVISDRSLFEVTHDNYILPRNRS